MPEVSIIVPIYNAEKYLTEMLNSIVTQSLKDFEIICVLDCPKDNSAEIVKNFQKKDMRIRMIENESNIGAALSRNKGMCAAKGAYVCFFDADDIFERDLLETAYQVITKNKADIVLYESDTFRERRPYTKLNVENESQYDTPFCLRDLSEEALLIWNSTPWNKMYRKEFLEANHLEYQDLSSSNDIYFSDMSMMLAKRIVHIGTDKKYVHYRVHTSTQISANRDPMNAWYAMKYLYYELKHREQFEENKKYFYIKFLHTLTYDLRMSKSAERAKETYDKIRQQGQAIGIFELDERDFENPCYAAEIRKFLTEDYESHWFEEFIRLRVQMKCYATRMLELYEKCEANGFTIAVWGAGPAGRTVLRFFDEYKKHICYVIDNDKNKQGEWLEGRKIVAFDVVEQEIQVIFVPNHNYFSAIWQQVKQCRSNIQIIDLNEYFD